MADNLTLYSDVKNSDIQTFYDRVMLRRAYPYEVHANWAQQRPIPQREGKYILFRRYERLDLAKTPLTEAQTPDGSQMSKTDITAEIKQYGDFITLSDVVDLTWKDPVLTEAAELLGEQMGQTRDSLVRDIVLGEYFDNKDTGDYDNVKDAGGALSQDDLMDVVDKLLSDNARFLTRVIRPSTGYNTTPIRPAYVAVMHPKFRSTVEGFSDFVPVSEYPKGDEILDGEWGAINNVRIVFTTLADSGGEFESSSSDHVIPIFGADAYGVTELTGGGAQNIVKAHGSAGTGDPLNQRTTSGWKMFMTAKILNPSFMGIVHGAQTA